MKTLEKARENVDGTCGGTNRKVCPVSLRTTHHFHLSSIVSFCKLQTLKASLSLLAYRVKVLRWRFDLEKLLLGFDDAMNEVGFIPHS